VEQYYINTRFNFQRLATILAKCSEILVVAPFTVFCSATYSAAIASSIVDVPRWIIYNIIGHPAVCKINLCKNI